MESDLKERLERVLSSLCKTYQHTHTHVCHELRVASKQLGVDIEINNCEYGNPVVKIKGTVKQN